MLATKSWGSDHRIVTLRHIWFGSSVTPLGYEEPVPLHGSPGTLYTNSHLHPSPTLDASTTRSAC